MTVRRTVAILAMAILVIAALAAGAVWWWTSRPVPALDGRISLPGLRAPVEVRFDSYAIPHLYASDTNDAWMAVGYLQARDRLWQMELYRRAASGRLSEMFGEATIAVDARFLMLGLRRAAAAEWERTGSDVRLALERHADGVNAAIAAAGRWRLPAEFQLLRLRPEPWTPVDSLAIGKLFAWRLGENHAAELLRYDLGRAIGPRAAELLGDPPAWAPTIVAGASVASQVSGTRGVNGVRRVGEPGRKPEARILKPVELPPGLEWLSMDAHAASNSWVVSGARTASGRPLLANDPHLTIEMPSVWWEVQVSAPAFTVAGVTIPGIPFVIIGHNERIAWGLTNTGADVQDFFVERLDASRQRYLLGGRWLPLRVDRYQIGVRGRPEAVAFDVRSTGHGPVLNADAWDDPFNPAQRLDETVLALRWDAVSQGESGGAFEALARAQRWDEFLSAVRRFAAPAQNFVYADVEGNIGYAMSGVMPMRRSGDGATPTPGWVPDEEWLGSVSVTDLPAVLNPASGQIVTANNEVDRRLPYLITRDWVAPFRAQRIVDMLGDRQDLDLVAFAGMQADVRSLAADAIVRAVSELEAEARAAAAPAALRALDELQTWDRRVDGRPVVTLYEAFEQALWRRTFEDEMPPALYGRYYRYAANERYAGLHAIVHDRAAVWFDDRTTPDVRETRDEMMLRAAEDAVSLLTGRFGAEPGWAWDTLHAVRFSHALAGGGRVLDWFFSRGPIALAGDSMTVSKSSINLRQPYATVDAASYRQILDVGAWDQSLGVNTTGQSGHPGSPHYFDQNALWREGRYRPLPFTRGAVDTATASRLELVP